jgi:hypothetical protein
VQLVSNRPNSNTAKPQQLFRINAIRVDAERSTEIAYYTAKNREIKYNVYFSALSHVFYRLGTFHKNNTKDQIDT